MSRSQSGLKSVKRDWSSSTLSENHHDEAIDWPSSQPAVRPVAPVSGAQQRLKDIQDALAGNKVTTERERVLVNSNSSARADDQPPPAKKARQLPNSWDKPSQNVIPPVASSIKWSTSSTPQPARNYPGPPSAATKLDDVHAITNTSTSTSSKKKIPSIFLSKEQTQILKLVQEGNSVFYTGSAGTGKSVLLREIIKTLRKKYVKSPDAIAITASTGIAACNIGGVTIHSFSGIGLGIEKAEDLVKKIRKNKKASTRWLRTQVLIIDEVSMVDGDLFDKLAAIGSLIRKKNAPFGGIQVIVTGDFFQLPPVTKGTASVKFAFEADTWSQTIKRTFNLTKVFRQKDQEFVDMLNEMRFGQLSARSIAKFKTLTREIRYEDGLAATELFPRREDVERSNHSRMSHLTTESERYKSADGGTMEPGPQKDKMLLNFMAPSEIILRVDAQVMLIKNIDETLVNGSIGKVKRFVDPALHGREDDEIKEGKKKTVVASMGGKKYPIVEFAIPGGYVREVLVQQEVFKVELPNGEIVVSRSQVPLILSWAMSIHKSQGQTLDRVKVDLGKVFEKGQAYVALSRATSLQGLQVLNFDAAKVLAHPKVIQWSKTLETIADTS